MSIISISNEILVGLTLLFTTYEAKSHENPKNCYDGSIRLVRFGKTEAQKTSYCTNPTRTTLISRSCLQQKCDAYQKIARVDKNTLDSEVGKPGFKLCRQVSGEPQIVEFSVGTKWYKLDRCLFSSDGSYIDTGGLLESYFDEATGKH